MIFIIYKNDLILQIKINIVLFGDNTNLFDNFEEQEYKDDLNAISTRPVGNKLTPKIRKSRFLYWVQKVAWKKNKQL